MAVGKFGTEGAGAGAGLRVLPEAGTAAGQSWILSGRTTENGESRDIPIAFFPFRIGRREGLSLTLPRTTVSSIHAEILEVDGFLCVRDMKSTNGTYVNGDRIVEMRRLQENDLLQFADVPFRLRQIQTNRRSHTRCKDACDQALALVQFDRLINGSALIPHFQPIVDLNSNRVVSYEALARSRLVGLETPDFMFSAAAELGLTQELTHLLRRVAVNDSCLMPDLPHLFLNSHPCELENDGLLESCRLLRELAPHQRITIEIHEASMARPNQMLAIRQGLEELEMTLAFDDFGAGQARVVELAEVHPHYVKFDRSLVQNLDQADDTRRRFIAQLVGVVQDVGAIPLCEGVETEAEVQACQDAGFVLSQGYYHGRPMTIAHVIKGTLAGSHIE